MNTNMNMNGRKKRELLETVKRSEILDKFSNFTLVQDFKPEMLNSFHDTFGECKMDLKHRMNSNCEEEMVIIAWKNLRKFLVNPIENCVIGDGDESSPLSNFTNDYVR